jgi:RNA polymerase sigma-70 factor (ECF subfamily)
MMGGVDQENEFAFVAAACRSRIYRAACLLLDDPSEAEDATQQVLVIAWRGWSRFEGRCDPFTWLYAILRRICMKQRRKTAWQRLWRWNLPSHEVLLSHPAVGAGPDEAAVLQDDRLAVRRLLRRLSPKFREVLVLRYVEDFTVPEIARALRIPEGTVKSRLHFALGQAARQWGGEERHET